MQSMKVSVEELRDGDIIVEELFTNYVNVNISLVTKGTVVNEVVRNKLENFDMGKILVERSDEDNVSPAIIEKSRMDKKVEFKEGYKGNVYDIKEVFRSILNGEKLDVEKISRVSEDIFGNIDDIYMAIESISEIKDFDEYTYIHSVNVALYSILLGKWLKLEKDDIKDLVTASLMHDIGKAKVDQDIINKAGKLTDEEFVELRKHPQYGYDICEDMDGISDRVKEAILSHHEKIDGSGYPNGKKGDEISLFARIVAVSNVYDDITSNRAYRDRITPFESFDEIIEHGYGKLDSNIILTLLNNIGSLYVGLKVRMNTGEIGEIVFVPPRELSQPLIKIGDKFIDFSENQEYKIEEIIQN